MHVACSRCWRHVPGPRQLIMTIEPLTVSVPLLEISAVLAALDRGAARCLISAIQRFGLEVRLGLDRSRPFLSLFSAMPSLFMTIELPFWSFSVIAAVVVAQGQAVAARRGQDRDLLLVVEPQGHLAARDVSLLVVVVVGVIGGAFALLWSMPARGLCGRRGKKPRTTRRPFSGRKTALVDRPRRASPPAAQTPYVRPCPRG